ncbi:hypothetical protein [Aeromonas hydrophila]|uniref:hypothetical protein n=1 Tax=Aeromonas hydrophila TaxID=644 RepID=UPI0030160E2B
MNIAIIGATSQIFNDLFFQWIENGKEYSVFLYARNTYELDEKYSSVPYLGSIEILDIKDFISSEYKFMP